MFAHLSTSEACLIEEIEAIEHKSVEELREEQKQLKQRLYLYEHLAIMGKLSLCIAHELNNPLDGMKRYLSLARQKKMTHRRWIRTFPKS